ncbi:MAG: hypothetical protein ACU85E_08075 [Gammaproteobacteria bacterium]
MSAIKSLIFTIILASTPASAGELSLDCYQTDDGAITLFKRKDFIDPYFVNRALITAHGLGIDIQDTATAWIKWLLPKQQQDGRFQRYCRKPDEAWRVCAIADADDAMLATWLELLYRVSAKQSFSGAWQGSAQRAQHYLRTLKHPEWGTYLVAHEDPISLLMDNIEIYAAFATIAERQKSYISPQAYRNKRTELAKLKTAIDQLFWDDAKKSYRVASSNYELASFYPHVVAQIYPGLFALPTREAPETTFRKWMDRNGVAWLSMTQDKYPWGLIAVAAFQSNDPETARQWLVKAKPLRHSERWNVLEEVIYQALSIKLSTPDQRDSCQLNHAP